MSAEDEVMEVGGNDEQEEVENKVAQEEYRVWKKNTPFLYDCVVTTALEWPSLTVQWLPDYRKAASDKECSTHKVLLGTQSDGSDPNYIMIAEVSTSMWLLLKRFIICEFCKNRLCCLILIVLLMRSCTTKSVAKW